MVEEKSANWKGKNWKGREKRKAGSETNLLGVDVDLVEVDGGEGCGELLEDGSDDLAVMECGKKRVIRRERSAFGAGRLETRWPRWARTGSRGYVNPCRMVQNPCRVVQKPRALAQTSRDLPRSAPCEEMRGRG